MNGCELWAAGPAVCIKCVERSVWKACGLNKILVLTLFIWCLGKKLNYFSVWDREVGRGGLLLYGRAKVDILNSLL